MNKLSTYSVFKQMVLDNENIHMLSQEEVNQVQNILLYMMDDIHKTCEEENLSYVLSGGCALGAVRHKGFIPWDDDIDICMPRKDYDRFRDCFLKRYKNRYFVQEIRADKNYDLNFMKVRLKGTIFCEFLDSEPEKAGIFIDILPIENVCDSKIGRMFQWLLSDGMQFICSCVRIRKKRKVLLAMAGDSKEAARAIRIKAAVGVLFGFLSLNRWLLLTEKVLGHNKNENSNEIAIPTGGLHFRKDRYPRKWIFPKKPVVFENRKFYGMADNDKYLKRRYGDYMKIPPESERERHALKAFSIPDNLPQKGEPV